MRQIYIMRTLQNPFRRLADQQGFQFSDHFRFENVLNRVGILIDFTGSDVCVGNQVEFPEAMLNKVNEVMAPASVEQTQKSTSAPSSDGDVSTVAETEEGNRKLKKLKKAT